MEDLVAFLRHHPPFDSLDDRDLRTLSATATIDDFPPGATMLDAFSRPTDQLFVVLTGQVELWNSVETTGDRADEVLDPGGVFGYSALLSGSAVGPLARALGPVRAAHFPAAAVGPAFASIAGARFLAGTLTGPLSRSARVPSYGVVDQLIVSEPLVVAPTDTVEQAARRMTEQDNGFAVVALGTGRFGLLTDALLRAQITAAGRPSHTPVGQLVTEPARTVSTGTPAADALLDLTERELAALLVTDRSGALRGVVTRDDFLVSPSTAGMSFREQVARTESADELALLARRLPLVLGDLLRRGRSAGEVTTVNSTVVDAIVRRSLRIVFAGRPQLDLAQLTWLSLGSNGRREPVLSSDVDAAVVLDESVGTAADLAAHRSAFDAVTALLLRCGLSVDEHGAVPGRPLFSRTGQQWRAAAERWMAAPLEDNAMMMTSLLLDARPIQGDPGLPVVNEVFGDMRRHPGTLRLLLAESLSNRARLRSMRDVLARRGGTFSIKQHAITPLVDIARWAALAVGSPELSTRARLTAAAGSAMVPDDQAEILIESFEVLQRIRLAYQMRQLDRGEPPSDVLSIHRLSPLDRSLMAQAVREIATAQKRMANLAQVTPPASW